MRADVVELGNDERPYSPPIRIRTVLLLLALATLSYRLYPRAQAAWQLHSLATSVADYALCMVGPTGPTLMRDNQAEFGTLVRRRLVAAPADSKPFVECSGLARSATGSDEIAEAHTKTAADFREYRNLGAASAARASVDVLNVTTERLADTSRRAWPFVRGGYTRLVKASLSAHEALHPVAPDPPVVGSGLPNWRARYRAVRQTQAGFVVAWGHGANLGVYETHDLGVSWKLVAERSQPSDYMERCPIDDEGRSFTFSLSDDGRFTLLNSLGPDGAPYSTRLAEATEAIVAAACDADGMVVAFKASQAAAARLMLCPFRRSCTPMHLPLSSLALKQVSDVARVRGATVVASSDGQLVRVVSSRDAGRSWTPVTVAYDADEHRAVAMGLPAPERLLTLGDRLLLYGGAVRNDQAYLVLVSDDQGASWRTP
jgi:hypothetical protein